MTTTATDWSVQEFFGLDLGDARLNRRLLVLAETFAAQPEASINQASGDWQATKAAYAFFATPNATPDAILLPHRERTLERMQAHPLALLVQDTTFLNYTHHPATRNLGPIGGQQQGLVMHSTLAFTPTGLPLGVLAQQIWARPHPQARPAKPTHRPIAEKESAKWLSALSETFSLVPTETRIITIAFSGSRYFRVPGHCRSVARRVRHSCRPRPARRGRSRLAVGTYGHPSTGRNRDGQGRRPARAS